MEISKLHLALLGLSFCFDLGTCLDLVDPLFCPGPLEYYNELGCTAVFAKPEDKCPQSAYCEILKDLPTDKCPLNGKNYNVGEALRPEDANPCDVGCFCSDADGGAHFVCAIVDCFSPPIGPGCYKQRNATQCCSGLEVCPQSEEERPTCLVDGKIYKDGEYFQPANEPAKSCYCGPGYTGENIAPFCHERKNSCSLLLRHTSDIRAKCAPVYEHNQAPQKDCSYAHRCQNERDIVVSPPTKPVSSDNPDLKCVFGNLTMDIGDELNENTNYDSVCVKCICEMPPIPTCRRAPNEECDYSKYGKFDGR